MVDVDALLPSPPQEEDFSMDESIIVVNRVNPTKTTTNPSPPSLLPPADTYSKPNPGVLETLSPLGKFLVDRACASPAVANFLYWYLKVEMDDEVSGPFFSAVYDAFLVQLSTTNNECNILSKRLLVIENYIKEILTCQKEAIKQGRKRDDKIKILRKLLETKDLGSLPNKFDFVLLPLNPSVKINGLLVDKTYMFASAVYPCRLEFTELATDLKPLESTVSVGGGVATHSKAKGHRVIFKSGDDLRQDQLIMQMIALMDSLLKKVNLDLKLLTYGILAITQSDGIMEFVEDSMPLSAVEREFSTITSYLKKYNYDKSGDYEISPV
ncbi:hypothetical protein EON65_31045 [archaeon]|nr:MAG: hypothetical protein EON65_31045 [archaeon]